MSYGDELTAFRKYAELYPNNTTLLVDTYDTLRSGVPNAIRVFEELSEQNRMPKNMAFVSTAATSLTFPRKQEKC